MKLRYKIWLEQDDGKIFGIGPCEILERVEKTGSLKRAAEEINMSYSQAWNLINSLEKGLGFSLLIKKTGGQKGGGSKLTPEAQKILKAYKGFYQEASDILEELSIKWFKEIFPGLEKGKE